MSLLKLLRVKPRQGQLGTVNGNASLSVIGSNINAGGNIVINAVSASNEAPYSSEESISPYLLKSPPPRLTDVVLENKAMIVYLANATGRPLLAKRYMTQPKDNEEHLERVKQLVRMRDPYIAQIVHYEKDTTIVYLHGYPNIQPSTYAIQGIASMIEFKIFWGKWEKTINHIEDIARQSNVNIDWRACTPDWFLYNGDNWVLVHWEEFHAPDRLLDRLRDRLRLLDLRDLRDDRLDRLRDRLGLRLGLDDLRDLRDDRLDRLLRDLDLRDLLLRDLRRLLNPYIAGYQLLKLISNNFVHTSASGTIEEVEHSDTEFDDDDDAVEHMPCSDTTLMESLAINPGK